MIEIIVNGEPCEITAGASLADLVAQLQLPSQRIAIELNLAIVPKAVWSATILQAGDKLEIVHFVGGG